LGSNIPLSLRGVISQVRAGVQGVKNVTKNQPVDNVQEDEGRGEEDPGHAIDADCTLPPFLHDLLAVLHILLYQTINNLRVSEKQTNRGMKASGQLGKDCSWTWMDKMAIFIDFVMGSSSDFSRPSRLRSPPRTNFPL